MADTKGIRSQDEIERVAVRSIISACRLMEGGIAMFAPIMRNQSIESWGAKVSVPLVRKILRVCIDW